MDWTGRTQRTELLPQRMLLGQGNPSMVSSITSFSTASVGRPFLLMTAK